MVGKRDLTWSAPSVAAALPTSITAFGVTSLSEFAVGEPAPVPTPFSLPTPTSSPAASSLPDTISEPGRAGGSAVLLVLLGVIVMLGVASIGARRPLDRR